MLNVVATLRVKDAATAAFETLFSETRAAVLQNPACLRYDLQRRRRTTQEYAVLESWESAGAFRAHGASQVFVEFSAAAAELLAGPIEVSVYEPVGAQLGGPDAL